MKKTILAVFLLCPLFLLTACSFGNNIPASGTNSQDDSNNNVSSQPTASTAPATAQGEVKKFYPEPLVSQQPTQTTTVKPATGNPLPDNLQIKFYLADKYKPGTCYGIPAPVRDEDIAGMISRNSELAKLVKDKYKLKTDLEIYLKIKQIFGINLKAVSGGKYQYDFVDGQCCTLTSHVGTVENIGGKISDTTLSTESKNNPC